ncbi:MAG: phosphoglycerol geranylgeranyltransferase [Promethearchaeota archaeon]
MIDEYIEKSTYEYIINRINKEGTLHFSLIDPDPMRQGVNKAAKMAKYAEDAGTIFPGGISNISQHADAIFFMSLLNSSDPYFIIGQQALASYTIKSANLEAISMAYLIIEPGASAGWIGNARCFPREKPKLTAAYSLAAEMFGFKIVYLEAGSGSQRIPIEHIEMCSKILDIPIIVGGGVINKEDAKVFVEAGADIVVMGTFLENNLLKDNGTSLKVIIDEIKDCAKAHKKNFSLK